jgi:hypothetical protein
MSNLAGANQGCPLGGNSQSPAPPAQQVRQDLQMADAILQGQDEPGPIQEGAGPVHSLCNFRGFNAEQNQIGGVNCLGVGGRADWNDGNTVISFQHHSLAFQHSRPARVMVKKPHLVISAEVRAQQASQSSGANNYNFHVFLRPDGQAIIPGLSMQSAG